MKKIILAFAVVVAALCSQQLAAQTQINQGSISTFPYVITQPGSYILTSNITVPTANTTAFMISTNNVVFNLNGFTVSGPLTCSGSTCSSSSAYVGIYAIGSNVTVENGSVSGFYYDVLTSSGSVHDMQVSTCVVCIFANASVVRRNTVVGGAQIGISGQYATISDNSVSQAYGNGIYALNSTILNNVVSQTTGYGIDANKSSVQNNTVNYSSSWGIVLYGGYAGGNAILSSGSGDLFLGSYTVTTKTNACTTGAC